MLFLLIFTSRFLGYQSYGVGMELLWSGGVYAGMEWLWSWHPRLRHSAICVWSRRYGVRYGVGMELVWGRYGDGMESVWCYVLQSRSWISESF